MKIGKVEIPGKCMLAPMAGVTDKAFRQVCRKFGALYTVTEMVSAKAITFDDKKSKELLNIGKDEKPCGIQLFGYEPECLREAAKYVKQLRPDVVDINMGCPAPKVTKTGSGSTLMRKPTLCGEIVQALKEELGDIPITVKIRKGFSNKEITYEQVAKICEENGADAIAIHGRTKDEMYSGKCDLDAILRVKEIVKIPVIGNGDVCSVEDADKMMNYTGCDLVMVGRAAFGNPWIFQEIQTGVKRQISLSEIKEVMLWHASLLCEYKGEAIGMREARKHMAWYIKGIHGAAKFRKECSNLSMYKDLETLCRNL